MSDSSETAERRDALRGIFSMLLCVLIFGLMDALVKLAAERHPIGQIIFFRNLFAFIPLSFFIHRAGGLSVLRTRYVTQHILRSITGISAWR